LADPALPRANGPLRRALSPEGPLRRALSRLGLLAVAVAAGGLLAPGASRLLGDGALGWATDLAAHWVMLWLPLGAIGLGLLDAGGFVRLALAAAMLVLPWWWLPPSMPSAGAPAQLRVVVANVHLSNTDPAPLLAWAREPLPDVIAVIELTPRFAQALREQAGAQWPHQRLEPRDDPFGLGLLSRWPLRDVRVSSGEGGIAQLHAFVEAPAGTVEVIAVHPMPPIDRRWHGVRNRTLAALQPRGTHPAILLGDFNATPWSNAAPRLLAAGWRWFGGLHPTWPHSAWGIPIDTVWGHGPWQVTERAVGPPIGSDHRPVRAGLRLAASVP
jgi:endonuclease/exonuclease/phosphatase (EEP) superfamily protein YafD